MDNSHMLSVIEKKMCPNDRKVWARDLERKKKPVTLHALMSWMTVEMKPANARHSSDESGLTC